MIAGGLMAAGLCTFLVSTANVRVLHVLCFALIGLALSMLRGPLMKVISENTGVRQARMICTLFNMACFLGPLVAGVMATIFPWRTVFRVTGLLTGGMSVFALIAVSFLEKRGEIVFLPGGTVGRKGFGRVFRQENFGIYTLLNIFPEIVGTSVAFWVPLYAQERLGLSADSASAVYSLLSLSTLITPFAALFLYERISQNGLKIIFGTLALAGCGFLAARFAAVPAVNISCLLLARVAAGTAGGIIWSVYLPGLAPSGCVSSANGVMDAVAYAAVSLATILFSVVVSRTNWQGLTTLWSGLMFLGVLIALVGLKKEKAG